MENFQDPSNESREPVNIDILKLYNIDQATAHPASIAQVLEQIPVDDSISVFYGLTRELQSGTFPYLEHRTQTQIVNGLPVQNIAELLNDLTSDDRTAFLEDLSLSERSRFIELLNDENKEKTLHFLKYPDDTVARLVNTNYATIAENMTIAEASIHLQELNNDTEAINVVYVVDEQGKLLDDIQIRRLVLNSPKTRISELMDQNCVYLTLEESIEEAVDKFMDYDRIVLPVVNQRNILIGVVTIDDIMDAAEGEETKSMQKFGGVDELDFPYVKTSLFKLTQKRATWLILLFVGEMLTATAMGFFESEIASAVVLALFVPLVISSGGNSGSQAATLIIRALALKEITAKDWWFVMRRELVSGLLLGSILGAIGFMRISLWQEMGWYNYGEHWMLIASTIFLSLIGIVLWGTLSGSMIPILLKKLKLDPATSSAPFVATLVDVTGLIIYFSIAASILKGTLL